MKKLTIREIQLKKYQLEKNLLILIDQFKKETMMNVTAIRLKSLKSQISAGNGEVVKVETVIGI